MDKFLVGIAVATGVLFVLIGCGPADSTLYFVGVNGSDSNSATQAEHPSTPWATISRASSSVLSGDTVDILPGSYSATGWTITATGSAEHPITFTGNNGSLPSPILTSSQWSALNITGSSYVVVKGLKITSTDKNPLDCGYGISIGGLSNHITVENCTVHDCGGGGIGTANSGTGGCDYISILNNIVYNNAWYSTYEESGISLWEQYNSNPGDTGVHNVISGNLCFRNSNKFCPEAKHTDGEGIIVDCGYNHSSAQGGKDSPAATTVVSYNTCYGNGGSGVECYLDDNVIFIHNTCYENAQDPLYGGGGEVMVNSSSGCEILKNICYADGAAHDACDSIYADGGGTVIDNNCFCNGVDSVESGTENVFDNPQFRRPSADIPDFRVRRHGPADPKSGTIGAWVTYGK